MATTEQLIIRASWEGRDLEQGASKGKKSITDMDKAARLATRALTALGGAMVVRHFGRMADQWTNINNKLRLVTDSTEGLIDKQNQLFDIAQKSRAAYESTAVLYARIARSTRTLNATDADRLTVTQALTQGFIVSGSTAQEAKSAIIQLSQGLASGTLRGEEFNSVNEQGARIMQALKDELGMTTGQLREMAHAGKLTTEMVFAALLHQAGQINTEFATMTPTLAQAGETLSNALLQKVGQINEATGATEGMAGAMLTLAGNVDLVSDAIIALSAALAVGAVGKLLAGGAGAVGGVGKLAGWAGKAGGAVAGVARTVAPYATGAVGGVAGTSMGTGGVATAARVLGGAGSAAWLGVQFAISAAKHFAELNAGRQTPEIGGPGTRTYYPQAGGGYAPFEPYGPTRPSVQPYAETRVRAPGVSDAQMRAAMAPARDIDGPSNARAFDDTSALAGMRAAEMALDEARDRVALQTMSAAQREDFLLENRQVSERVTMRLVVGEGKQLDALRVLQGQEVKMVGLQRDKAEGAKEANAAAEEEVRQRAETVQATQAVISTILQLNGSMGLLDAALMSVVGGDAIGALQYAFLGLVDAFGELSSASDAYEDHLRRMQQFYASQLQNTIDLTNSILGSNEAYRQARQDALRPFLDEFERLEGVFGTTHEAVRTFIDTLQLVMGVQGPDYWTANAARMTELEGRMRQMMPDFMATLDAAGTSLQTFMSDIAIMLGPESTFDDLARTIFGLIDVTGQWNDALTGLDAAAQRAVRATFDMEEMALRQRASVAFAEAGASPVAQSEVWEQFLGELDVLTRAERIAMAGGGATQAGAGAAGGGAPGADVTGPIPVTVDISIEPDAIELADVIRLIKISASIFDIIALPQAMEQLRVRQHVALVPMEADLGDMVAVGEKLMNLPVQGLLDIEPQLTPLSRLVTLRDINQGDVMPLPVTGLLDIEPWSRGLDSLVALNDSKMPLPVTGLLDIASQLTPLSQLVTLRDINQGDRLRLPVTGLLDIRSQLTPLAQLVSVREVGQGGAQLRLPVAGLLDINPWSRALGDLVMLSDSKMPADATGKLAIAKQLTPLSDIISLRPETSSAGLMGIPIAGHVNVTPLVLPLADLLSVAASPRMPVAVTGLLDIAPQLAPLSQLITIRDINQGDRLPLPVTGLLDIVPQSVPLNDIITIGAAASPIAVEVVRSDVDLTPVVVPLQELLTVDGSGFDLVDTVAAALVQIKDDRMIDFV